MKSSELRSGSPVRPESVAATRASSRSSRSTVTPGPHPPRPHSSALSVSSRSVTLNGGVEERILRLHHEVDVYKRKLDKEKRRASALVAKRERLKVAIEEKRRSNAAWAPDTLQEVQRLKRLWERKHNTLRVKLNASMSETARLREQITQQRRERLDALAHSEKLHGDIKQTKAVLAAVLLDSEEAAQLRRDIAIKQAALQQRRKATQFEFERRWLELEQVFQQDEAEEKKSPARHVRGSSSGSGSGSGGGASAKSASALQRRAKRKSKAIGKARPGKSAMSSAHSLLETAQHKMSLALAEQKVQSFEQGFSVIAKATGVRNIEHMVDHFIEREREAASMFAAVNTLAAEVEASQAELASLRNSLQKMRGKEDEQRRGLTVLGTLRDRISAVDGKIKATGIAHQIVRMQLDSVKLSVARLYRSADCASTVAFQRVVSSPASSPVPTAGDSYGAAGASMASTAGRSRTSVSIAISAATKDGGMRSPSRLRRRGSTTELHVTDRNILQLMGVIEQRAMELLLVHAKQKSRGTGPVRLGAPLPPHRHRRIAPPAADLPAVGSLPDVLEGIESGEEDDDGSVDSPVTRPLSHEELRNRLYHRAPPSLSGTATPSRIASSRRSTAASTLSDM
eukprot:PLAT3589.2.p1 GENE.PLAT3589.2~~PLAT3589.2.p1  ORF type:complete len:627 (+),score=207.00 PLAT3589.2:33-1913(+)